MPTLRQLEYLVAIAETRHFRKAAEKCGATQPTLSAQLAALEADLGVQLVERSRSSVLLTPAGARVLVIAQRMLKDAREIADLAAGERGEFVGAMRLGLPPTIGPYLLPRVLPALRRAAPAFKIYVREEIPTRLPSALADGVFDVIVAPLPIQGADLERAALFREPLFLVTADDHPLAAKGAVDPADLRGEAVLALERGHQLHEQVDAICQEYGARLRFDYEGTSLETLRQMTALGMGVSFLPGLFVATALDRDAGVVALPVRGKSLSRTIGAAWRRTSARRADYGVFLDQVRTAVARDFPTFPRL